MPSLKTTRQKRTLCTLWAEKGRGVGKSQRVCAPRDSHPLREGMQRARRATTHSAEGQTRLITMVAGRDTKMVVTTPKVRSIGVGLVGHHSSSSLPGFILRANNRTWRGGAHACIQNTPNAMSLAQVEMPCHDTQAAVKTVSMKKPCDTKTTSGLSWDYNCFRTPTCTPAAS
jgi:hypothetical protein